MRELVVLVGGEKVTVRTERRNPHFGHWCTAREIPQMVQYLSPDEQRALARIQEFSKHENAVFKILAISNLWVRVKYRLKKNEVTPVIVCGKRVFRGVPSMRDLARLVSQA